MANNEELNGCASGCAGCSGCGHDHMDLPEDVSNNNTYRWRW